MEHDWLVETYMRDLLEKVAATARELAMGKSEEELSTSTDKLFDELIASFMNHPNVTKLLESPGKFLFGNKPTLADCVLGTFYTDMWANKKRHHREKWDAMIKDHQKFETYGKNFRKWAAEYYK